MASYYLVGGDDLLVYAHFKAGEREPFYIGKAWSSTGRAWCGRPDLDWQRAMEGHRYFDAEIVCRIDWRRTDVPRTNRFGSLIEAHVIGHHHTTVCNYLHRTHPGLARLLEPSLIDDDDHPLDAHGVRVALDAWHDRFPTEPWWGPPWRYRQED